MIARYVTNTYKITDTYKKILINTKDAKIKIAPSNDNNTNLVFFEKKRRPYKFFVQDDTLTVKPQKTKWYNFLRIGVEHSEIKLFVPNSILEMISIRSNVGNVDICSITSDGTIDIKINTGNVNIESIECKDFNFKGNTGTVSLNKSFAKERISIKCNTGKALLNDCSAPEIFVKTNTGKVCGHLPSNTVFEVRTNTGKIETPQIPIGETVGVRCEIKTNTGNVKFE